MSTEYAVFFSSQVRLLTDIYFKQIVSFKLVVSEWKAERRNQATTQKDCSFIDKTALHIVDFWFGGDTS
jgi:hypothetical protein